MLLSRFWYILLAAIAVAATAAAMLAAAVINARSDDALSQSLARDRVIVDAMLRLESRSRLDRMAFITVDAKFGSLLRQARDLTDEKRLKELSESAKETMRGHVARIVEASRGEGAAAPASDLEPDIAFALDAEGRIIAQLGPLSANPPGASLATFPLVKRALQGYLRDDVWVYDRRVYRVAARPVMAGTEYAGAIVHGYRLDKGLPETLAKNLGGATVVFFFGTTALGSHVPADVAQAPQPAEISSELSAVLAAPKFQTASSSEVVALRGGGRAIFAKITGAAAGVGVGYAIARPRTVVSSPEELFRQASQDDVRALPIPLLGGALLVLSLVGLFFLYVERDRHLNMLMKKTGEIAAGERDRLVVTEWRGGYRKLADKINQAIEKEVEKSADRAPTTRKKANLDEILGPTPEAAGAPFFGFASDNQPAPQSSPGVLPVPPASRPGVSVPKAPPSAPGLQRAAPSPTPAVSAPVMPAPAMPRPPAAPVVAAGAPSLQVAMTSQNADDGGSFDETAHWHEIYDQYVATKRQCGEPIDNLTFDKFGITLKKTRDQIIEKHGAKSVRFSVQVKEGKAALKAQPVKR